MARFGTPGKQDDPLAYVDSRLSNTPCVQGPREPTIYDRSFPLWTEWRVQENPTTGTVGDFWKLTNFVNGDAIWTKVGGGGNAIEEFTTDDALTVLPDASDNVNVVGVGETQTRGDVANTIGIFSPRTAEFIVDPTLNNGTHTTIQAAITDASAGDTIFIRPGTYTETLTIAKALFFQAYNKPTRQSNSPTIIQAASGEIHSITANVKFNGLDFRTNGAGILDESTDINVQFADCRIFGENGVTAFTTDFTGNVYFLNCTITGDTSTSKLFDSTSGLFWFEKCNIDAFYNVASTASGSSVIMRYCSASLKLDISGTANFQAFSSEFGTTLTPYQNETWLTQTANASFLFNCKLYSGTATCIDVAGGATVTISNCTLNASNTNVISGAGTINYSGLTFTGTSSNISTTTQTQNVEGPSRIIGSSNVGANNYLRTQNSDNTNAASNSLVEARVGGSSGGDPFLKVNVAGIKTYNIGIDNSDSDKLKITDGTSPSAGNTYLSITGSGDASFDYGTGYLGLPSGTTAQRPGTPVEGMLRSNTDNNDLEFYDGSGWVALPSSGTGDVLQIVTATTNTASSTSNIIPFDNTIPQNTEGAQILTATITPESATSNLIVEFFSYGTNIGTLAVFRDSTANAISAMYPGQNDTSAAICAVTASGSTAATTFKIRYGYTTGGTVYINQNAAGAKYSTASLAIMKITEYEP